MPSLSVCMMVQNSEKTLILALESLNYIYDELIIVDGGSNDSTCEIALKYGAKIIHSPWCGNHSQQRNVYLANVRTDWIFVLDSDEFVDNGLIDFLQHIKSSSKYINTDNFWFPRKWISPDLKDYYIVSKPHYPDYQRRLFKYNKNIYYQGQIHETIFNLANQGEILPNVSIYHLDLFINSEEKRKEKVLKYSRFDPRDGASNYYLPNMKEIQLEKVEIEKIIAPVKQLLDDLSNKNIEESELNNLILPEIKNDEFYYAILEIVQSRDIKTALEIGSSSGYGSTEALVKGFHNNPSKPKLFCMEVSKNRFNELVKTYEHDLFVKCYNMSSVPINKFPSKQEIADFYNTKKTNLNLYELERIFGWLEQDINYIKNSGVPEDGIQKIKQENKINFFDFVLIDGSEFTGTSELEEVYGAKYICLDDINTFKNYQNFNRLLQDPHYTLIKSNLNLRNGYAIFERNSLEPIIKFYSNGELPVEFFTIVLNGQPFIRYHIEIFKQLPFKWHWHIVEGVADLKHDTSWSVKLGGHISDEIHKDGRSYDGTSEYIDELAQLYPNNITVYRQPEGVFWDGKRAMVNAPLANIQEECLLWQVDVDELWTLEQICTAREMFISHPDKTAAFYWCWYFVGEKLIISTRNCYAQNPQQEWLRTWRFKPGYVWAAHEPPVLVEALADGQYRNVAAINPFLHQETEHHNLVFHHFAYVTEEQLTFKEKYYGYKNAVSQWKALQKNTKFPILLSEYFPWVQDTTQVDIAYRRGIIPIAQRDKITNNWKFLQSENIQKQILQIRKPSPIIIIDGVFFQLYKTGIARVWKSLLEEWANNEFAQHIIVLDRAGTTPKIPGIRYINLAPYNYDNTEIDREMLQQVCDEEGADLFISSYYTTPITTPSVFMAYDMIPEVMGWDLTHPMWREKHQAIQQASAYIAISNNTARDLVNCFTDISIETVTVAYCGVPDSFVPANSEDIAAFKNKYGITKPYFILVGAGSGYKNSILFFQAFSQLASSYGFDIVLTGSGGILAPEYRVYTSGSIVHTLQLSDEELAVAYSGAVALVYPSKYEGFGMPVIEAMACGCPVIACPNASIPEVAGEAAIYISDDDVNGLVNALCEVQKPKIRQSLIASGLAQAQKFSWSKMADIVSSTLIDTTLVSLNLREINLIIFPDWTTSEDLITLELAQVIKTLATHTENSNTTLLIDTTNIATEDAELLLSSITMSLLMEEDLDLTDGLEIALVVNLADIQWQALLPRIHGRIILEYENQQALVQAKGETLASYELASFNQVQDEEFFFCLSEKLFHQGKWKEAIASYQKLIELYQGSADVYWNLSQCYRNLNLLDEYFQTLKQGIKNHPTDGRFHFTLIIDLRRNGRTQEAIYYADQACQCLPDDYTFQLLKHLTVPSIYNNPEEISFYRQRYTQGLQTLIAETSLNTVQEKQSALAGINRLTNFYLSYQAQNDIDLQRQYGNLVHQIMAANFPQWVVPVSMPQLQANQKIRVGYASHYLHSYSGTLWLTGWLKYCDRHNFEIYCYYTGNEPDAVTEKFQEYSDVFHHIPYNLPAVCEQIIADNLHILVYPEIGMNPQTMSMAALRLAPVQCTAWGHPVTTGLSTIDYFLSSELMEAENAQEHYSEKLIHLPNIGVSYPKPYIPPVGKNRADFGLSDDDVLYLCCQAPFKYLPQYDFILAEIAYRVPQAKFIFLRGTLLQERLQRAFATLGLEFLDYCVFLSIPERFDYLMINLLSDVYLDTFTWSGGNTTLEAIACNLPIVTCPGEFMRGRHSDSFLKMLGVTDTIAKDEAEYIEIAVKLGLDPNWRGKISERMSQLHDRLFDDKVCVAGLEAFYKQVVENTSIYPH